MLGALVLLPGCRTIGYVGHVARGHVALLARQQSIAEVRSDPATPEALRATLGEIAAARRFASTHLGLPRNRSYTRYVELERDYVSWVVVATPEFSLDPVPLCLPVAGCVPYRGWFSRERAEREAERLAAAGLDTWVGGVAAYSTLGWFADPVVSSMLREGPANAVGTVFHELAHQRLYVRDDSAFNEAYASFVELQGLREWRASRGLDQSDADADVDPARQSFRKRLQALVAELEALYASDLDASAMREAKRSALAAFREEYRQRVQRDWRGLDGHARWIEDGLNNAALQPFRLYESQVPAFAALFAREAGDWQRFHRAAERLARLAPESRRAELQTLAASAQTSP